MAYSKPGQLYQHITIRGGDEARTFVVRFDEDASTDKTFDSYQKALFYVIGVLTHAGMDE